MFKSFHSSLKFQLLASTLSVTFILSAVTALVLQRQFVEQEHQSGDLLLESAGTLASGISAQFYERYGDVQAFAQNTILQDQSEENREKITAVLNEYVRLYGIYTSIIYVAADGSYVASNTKTAGGKVLDAAPLKVSHAEAPWFRAVMNGEFTEDKAKAFAGTFVEQPMIDPLTSALYGTEMLGNSFSSVVRDPSGKIIGALSNRADFIWVEAEVAASSKRMRLNNFGNAHITIFDGLGRLVIDHQNGDSVGRDFKILFKTDGKAKEIAADRDYIRAMPEQKGFFIDQLTQEESLGANLKIDDAKFISSLGWDISIFNSKDIIFADLIKKKSILIVSLTGLALFFGIASWIFSNRISSNFIQVADKLKAAAETSHKTALKLTKASQSVSDSSTDQSAAVQETVSSMSEITSMIAQTNVNVKECTQIASRVTSRSEQGNQTMRRLVSAMDAVNHANSQLQNMANIINEVSAKTMVINDIVFKTQLLSINASIEAARAGQHGKGFAVVAEEVGNLAQMSGNAAKEIQLLISDSQKQVLQIIEVTQSRSKESQNVSQEAVQAFTEIASGIIAINERLGGVTQATHEQEIGIQQISVAMTQMDQSTQRNSSLAAEANDLATDIGRQSEMSFRIVKALRTIVIGSQANRPQKPASFVDSLIDESPLREGPSADGLTKNDALPTDSKLVSIMGRFESKLKVPGDSPGQASYSDEIDGDDHSFKKPA